MTNLNFGEVTELKPYFATHDFQHLKRFDFSEKRLQKRHSFQIFKLNLFPTGLWYGTNSWHILRHSGALSKNYNFETLGKS